jgi:hypothetical protein
MRLQVRATVHKAMSEIDMFLKEHFNKTITKEEAVKAIGEAGYEINDPAILKSIM